MKNIVSCARLAALPLALAAAWPAYSQTQLVEMVVTATRYESRAAVVLSDVTVIDREEIENSTSRTVTELLARMAGVQMAANGGLGKQSGLFIRGTETRHVLLLIDGVRHGSATLGAASLDNIPLSAIDRIEVLKGPASALYGSDAVGGVVQIFTKRGKPGLHPHASVTLGSYGHRNSSTGLRGGNEAITYALNVGVLREKGFSATNLANGTGHNSDRDGFEQTSANASVAWKLAPGWRLNAHLLQAEGDNQVDNGPSAFNARGETTSQVHGVGLERQWQPGVRTQIKVSRSENLTTNFRTPTSTTRFDTTSNQVTLQHEHVTAFGLLLAGVESVKESVDSTTQYAVRERTVDSVFLGLQGESGRQNWQANVRRDDNSQFGGASTFFVGYGYQLSPAWRLHGGYGTSFKAPSFNDLFWPNAGNPNLQPEEGRNRELGISYSLNRHEVKLVRFEQRLQNLINWAPISPGDPFSPWAPANVDRAQIDGWSLGYKASHGPWAWQANLELLDARNKSSGVSFGKKLNRRADTHLTAAVFREVNHWTLGAHWLAASDRFDDTANTRRLAGYGVVDLSAGRALARDWRLQVRLNNLADKTYQTAHGFNQPGRAAFVTLNWQPQR